MANIAAAGDRFEVTLDSGRSISARGPWSAQVYRIWRTVPKYWLSFLRRLRATRVQFRTIPNFAARPSRLLAVVPQP